MNKNIIIILLVMITSIVGQFRPEERNSNPKLMIKWKMTEFLDISEKQAETFFPRVNAMEKEVQLISYKLSEAEDELHSIQLTDPSHSPAHCPICLHLKLGYE